MDLISKINECRPKLEELDFDSVILSKSYRNAIIKSEGRGNSYYGNNNKLLNSVKGLVGEYFVSHWLSMVECVDFNLKAEDLDDDRFYFKNTQCNGIEVHNKDGLGSFELDGVISIDGKKSLIEVKVCELEYISDFILNKLRHNLSLMKLGLSDLNLNYFLFASNQICDFRCLESYNLENTHLFDLGFSKSEISKYSRELVEYVKSN